MAKVIKGHQPLKEQLKSAKSSVAISVAMIVLAAAFMVLKLVTTQNLFFLCVFVPILFFSIDLKTKVQKVGIIKAGILGESQALIELDRTLGKEYTILNCVNVYFNEQKSQVDNIIVGPSGVYVCEVKNIRGHISGKADANVWEVQKTSSGGYKSNKQMYSPLMQVATHVKRTQNYLKQEGFSVPVSGMVYFTGGRCKLEIDGLTKHTPVFTADMLPWLKKHIVGKEACLSEKQIKEICQSLAE